MRSGGGRAATADAVSAGWDVKFAVPRAGAVDGDRDRDHPDHRRAGGRGPSAHRVRRGCGDGAGTDRRGSGRRRHTGRPRSGQPARDHLVERTEGWAAGLRLVALQLRGDADPAGFVDAFSDPRTLRDIHRRAAEWHRRHSLPLDAIRYALRGGLWPLAAEILGIHVAASVTRPRPRNTCAPRLTPTNAEIADELYLSVNTVKTHQRMVYRKLGADGRRDAVRQAEQQLRLL